ncbi:MAG: fumarylacetoacetate hydrolase family protein [Alphaproteobacteria bacterium]|nr:fumarylacetoacetate hydrolase family protein [Alphaproteobacteria bacterium]
MKLVTFTDNAGTRIGIAKDDGIIDLKKADADLPRDMITLMSEWSTHRATVERATTRKADAPLKSVKLEAPVPRPGKILAIGLNYADHIEESGQKTPEQQVWFCKHVTSINAPFAPVQMPKVSMLLDYEAELVAIIGKRCKHVPKEKAHEVIFGYAAGNDVTVRDWQFKTPQWMLGKSFDTHAPFGPWIVTSDEIGDPHTLGIRAFVNGEKRQESNTKHLVFNIFDQIALLSQAMTLEPGDIIFTGTPGGVGAAMKPPQFMKIGDVTRIEIDKIGAIEATVAAEP